MNALHGNERTYLVFDTDIWNGFNDELGWAMDLTQGFVYPAVFDPHIKAYDITDDIGDNVEVCDARLYYFNRLTVKENERLLRFTGNDMDDVWSEHLTAGTVYVLDVENHIIDDVNDYVFLFGDRFDNFEEIIL